MMAWLKLPHVADFVLDGIDIASSQTYPDLSAVFSYRLHCIQDQVHGNLLELGWVRMDAAHIRAKIEFHLNRIRDGAAHQLEALADRRGQVNRLHYELALAHIRQHLSGEIGGLVAGVEGVFQDIGNVGARFPKFDCQTDVPDNSGKEIVEIMSDSASEH